MGDVAGRNIIVLSDGTGNSAGKLFKTNVWRVYEALDLSNASQVAFYDDGVGTSSIKPLAVLGGAFGWGLKRNLLALYTFLCRNYNPGDNDRPADRIYGFGFSRGAFTMRVLIKFVLSQGLVKNYNSNDDLHQKALWLYRDFRKGHNTRFRIEIVARKIRDLILWPFRPDKIEIERVPEIRFLGLWDTVDAYGLPVDELKKGIDQYIWPLALEDRELDPRIKKACHALSIDDKRTTFHPLLWDECDAEQHSGRERTGEETLTQVWFAGAHANVGGGYPDDGLSTVPLRWMVRQADTCGVAFNPHAVREIEAGFSPFGRLYDSRAGGGAYYRYGPRRLDPPCDKQGAVIPHPKVHETVLWRMAVGTDAYAPLSLPNDLRIVTDSVSEPERTGAASAAAPQGKHSPVDIMTFETYQAAARSGQLHVAPRAGQPATAEDQKRIAELSFVLEKPDDNTLDLIWDTVWWRGVAYFATLTATAALVAYPFLPYGIGVTPFWIREMAESVAPLTNGVVDLVGMFLPSFAKSWIDAFKANPWSVTLLVTWVAVCIAWGSLIDRRIHDRALAAWNTTWRGSRADWFRSRLKVRATLNVVLIALALLAAAGAYYGIRHPDLSACGDPKADDDTLFGPEFCIFLANVANLIFFGAIAVVSAVAAVVNIAWSFVLRRLAAQAQSEHEERPGFALRVAHRLRTSDRLSAVRRWLSTKGVPAVFALALVALALYGLNRLSFAMASAGGFICRSKSPPKALTKPVEVAITSRNICNGTVVGVRQGEKYRITFQDAKDWRDPVIPGGGYVGAWGFETPSKVPQMLLAVPMRRDLGERWFALIAKVGTSGDEQYILQEGGTVIEPRRTGELFVFVNDAVVGLPYLSDVFYRGNLGQATIKIEEVKSQPGN